jgi:hypothetical protein
MLCAPVREPQSLTLLGRRSFLQEMTRKGIEKVKK